VCVCVCLCVCVCSCVCFVAHWLFVRSYLSRNFDADHKRLQNQLLAMQLQVAVFLVLLAFMCPCVVRVCFLRFLRLTVSHSLIPPRSSLLPRLAPHRHGSDSTHQASPFILHLSNLCHVHSVFCDSVCRPQDLCRADCY
jgi:hypothetical protein